MVKRDNMSSRSTALMQIIEDQRREIDKYKNKLRDVVTAHKSLLKEKEALEESIKVIQNQSNFGNDDTDSVASNETNDGRNVAALVSSIATLTTEKNRLESSFLADNKILREEKELAEKRLEELLHKLSRRDVQLEELKSRVILERHERDKQQADHGAMMKELQSLLANERSSRLKLEESLTELRKRNTGSVAVQIEKYQKTIESLENELDISRRKLELAEKRGNEPPRELIKLQDEIRNLQIEHQTAIHQERQRAEQVEEKAKKQALIQEERVINLEARLSELSATVGTYDRLRLQDQYEIVKLKEYISTVSADHLKVSTDNRCAESETPTTNCIPLEEFPVSNNIDIHAVCLEELERLRSELELCKSEMKVKKETSGSYNSMGDLVKNLQERIRTLTEECVSKEKKMQLEIDHMKQSLREEKARFKEALSTTESDYRGKLLLLESELQKLRERSMAMIEDKEQEIHSLQGTFQTFLPGSRNKERGDIPTLPSMRDGPRMLHYANELARRDVDIVNLRRSKHQAETALRDLQRRAAADAESFREERKSLLEEISRFTRYQSREGANLEYLKNVVLSFLLSNDALSKRHMCNAIAAVLKFTDQEQEKIARQSHNKWWNAGKL